MAIIIIIVANFITNVKRVLYINDVNTSKMIKVKAFNNINHKITFMSKVPTATPGQRKEIDTLMDAIGINPLQTIELYARDIARFILTKTKGPVVIFVGKGHNGGVGLCVVKHLMNYQVKTAVVLCEDSRKFRQEEKKFLETLLRIKANIFKLKEKDIDVMISQSRLIVDGLVGYQLHNDPKDKIREAIELINSSKKKVLSIDIPTGIDSLTGKEHNPHIVANYTVCAGIALTGTKNKKCGQVYLSDVGIPDVVYNAVHFNTKPNFRRRTFYKK